MFAVINLNGNQYKVEKGKDIKIAKTDTDKKTLKVSDVLLVEDEKGIQVGTPNVSKAFVELEIIENKRDKKVLVEKFKSKVRYSRTLGHRQDYTVAKVKEISYEK